MSAEETQVGFVTMGLGVTFKPEKTISIGEYGHG